MRWLPLLIAALILSGCSSLKFWESDEPDELAPAELVDLDEEIRIEKRWSRGVGGRDELFSALHPAIDSGVLYAADDSGEVVAISTDTGKYLWKENLRRKLSGGVGTGGGLVLVADIEGRVYALDSRDGSRRWRTEVGREVLSAPASDGRIVAVQTLDGFVIGLDASDGSVRWRYQIDIPSLTLRAPTSPVMTGNTIIAGFASGKVVALAADSGNALWENRVAVPSGRTELERMVDIAGSPVLEGDVVYVTSYQGRTAAITRGTGRSLWYQDMSSYRRPALGEGQVYVTLADDQVAALRINSGQELWTNVRMKYRKLSAPAYASGYVAVGDAEGYLHVMSATDGRLVGRRKVDGSGIDAPILSDGGSVYVFDNDGGITAYEFRPR